MANTSRVSRALTWWVVVALFTAPLAAEEETVWIG